MFDLYGVGLRQAFSTPNLLKELNLKVFTYTVESRCNLDLLTISVFTTSEAFRENGVFQIGRLSTGDSLDMSMQDESLIIANDATLKDMEVMSC